MGWLTWVQNLDSPPSNWRTTNQIDTGSNPVGGIIQKGDKMELTNEEKEVVKMLIKKHLKEIEDPAVMQDATPSFFAADKKYDEFVKKLLKKF